MPSGLAGCDLNPCGEGLCIDLEDGSVPSYTCQCSSGWLKDSHGSCSVRQPEDPCEEAECGRGECVENDRAPKGFFCECEDGWRLDEQGSCLAQTTSCEPNPCRNDGRCNAGDDGPGSFQCECPDGFFGDHCQQVEVRGPCAEEDPCGDGACVEDAESSSGFSCSCYPGFSRDASGECRVPVNNQGEASCFDGELNGQETGIDCGAGGPSGGFECSLCGPGFGCESSDNCEEGLVCRNRTLSCGPATQPPGVYLQLQGLEIRGVSPVQFREVLQVPFTAKMAKRTGAADVTIDRITEGPPAGSARRGLGGFRQHGARARSTQASAVAVEIDFTLQFEPAANSFEVERATRAYISSDPNIGGNGLLEDLQAAVPALATELELAAGGVRVQSEVLAEERVEGVQGAGGPQAPSGRDGDGGNGASTGVIVGAVIGAIVVAGALVAGGLMLWGQQTGNGPFGNMAAKAKGY